MKVPKKVQEIQQSLVKMKGDWASISYSQLSVYANCPLCWYRSYIKKEAPFVPSIHTVFGTSMHETIQKWLDLLYNDTVKAATAFDTSSYLMERLKKNYGADRKGLGKDYSSAKELAEFYQEGVAILDYIKKNRVRYFDRKQVFLVGCELPLLVKIGQNFYFKGFIDCLLYDEALDKWTILDFKTSTSGWSADTRKNFLKTAQLLLYKHFLAQEYGLDPEKIKVEYFIVKRKVNEEAEYESMKRRVQLFEPSNGSARIKKAVGMITTFVSEAVDSTGKYQEKEYKASPSFESCKYCVFNKDCKVAVKSETDELRNKALANFKSKELHTS